MSIKITKGEKKHLPGVLQLIQELALFEKAPDEVVVTLDVLEKDGFGDKPVFDFFVALDNENVVGMALYYVKYSTWKGKCIFLDDLVVTEKYRGRGIGEKLFSEVARVSKEMQVKKMEWQVLDWNEPAIKFYKKLHAHFDGEWINCKLTDKELYAY